MEPLSTQGDTSITPHLQSNTHTPDPYLQASTQPTKPTQLKKKTTRFCIYLMFLCLCIGYRYISYL